MISTFPVILSSAFFRGNLTLLNQTLTSKIQAQTDGDGDFISFAIGFDLGDTTSLAADYLLPDWKRVLKDTVSLSSVFSTLP